MDSLVLNFKLDIWRFNFPIYVLIETDFLQFSQRSPLVMKSFNETSSNSL